MSIVVVERVPSGATVERYVEVNERTLETLFHRYQSLRTDPLTLGGLPAVFHYYTWVRNDGIHLYQIQLYTLAGGRGYVVTGTTAAASPRLQQEVRILVDILLTFRARADVLRYGVRPGAYEQNSGWPSRGVEWSTQPTRTQRRRRPI